MDGREVELKFAIQPGDAEKLFRHPALVAAAPRRSSARLVSTYFDTPDAYLKRHRISLRVRSSDVGLTQTVKRAAVSRIEREEFEREGGQEPDIGWLKTTPLWPMLEKGDVEGRLEPQFSVDVQRVTLPVTYRGATIEGALDEGAIKAKGLVSPVREFELELRDGPPRAVLALGRRLARDLPLVPSLTSKSEHGHAVADLTWGQPAKHLDVDLSHATTTAQAFAAIVQACLSILLRNTTLVVETDEAEAVHKARVALRRLRAALALFKPALRRDRLERLRRDLGWAWRRFSETRDADVMVAALAGRTGGTDALAAILGRSQAESHARLAEMLASARWRLLCLDLVALSMKGVRRSRRERPWRPFARRRLVRLRRRVSRRATGLRHRPMDELHALRKDAKTLRYDIELFAGDEMLGGAKAVRKLHGHLQTLQDSLGTLHDRHAFETRLRTLVDASEPPGGAGARGWARAAFAAGRIVERERADGDDFGTARKAARRVRHARAFT